MTSDIGSLVLTVIASLGGVAVIVFALSRWLGQVWANRIVEAEKAAHARDLETAKADLAKESTDRSRKLEALLAHYERQIEEFYGPLFNMVHHVFIANHMQQELLIARDKDGNHWVSPEKAEQIKEFYQSTYFLPLHDEIRNIIRLKLYLIEGSEMPESFYLYLKHAAQERDQRTLWQSRGIDTSFLRGEPWPSSFYNDIKFGFETAMRNYERCLEGLKT